MLVKICGVARPSDAEALDGLADYVGFVVDPTSPRSAKPEDLPRLRAALARAVPVLVTATLPYGQAVDLAAEADVPVLQHHRPPTPHDLDRARARGIRLAPVAVYRPGVDLKAQVEALLAIPHEYVLVDAEKGSRERHQGGLKVPLEAMAQVAHMGRVALAGGITPENARLVASLKPYMVDVASGVEAAPGVKDMDKVRALLRALGLL